MSHLQLRFPAPTAQSGRSIRGLLDDPIRTLTFAGAMIAIVGALLPFMHVWLPGRGWFDITGFERSGDGGWVIELAVIAAVVTWHDGAWKSRVAILVLAPAILGAGCAMLLRDFHQDGARYLEDLRNSGGHGTFEPGYWLSLTGSLLLLAGGLGAAWRARERVSFRPQAAATGIAGLTGGIAGAVAGFFVGSVATPLLLRDATVGTTSTVAVFASMILMFLGAWFGAVSGVSLVRATRRP